MRHVFPWQLQKQIILNSIDIVWNMYLNHVELCSFISDELEYILKFMMSSKKKRNEMMHILSYILVFSLFFNEICRMTELETM